MDTDSPQKPSPSPPSTPPEGRRVSSTDIIKFVGLLVFFALLIIIGIAIWPYFEFFGTAEGRQELIDMVRGAGIAGVAIYLGLQFVQVVVAFIPGWIVQPIAGYIYGPWLGAAFSLLGALISSIVVFYVVRKLGAPFVQGMIGSKDSKMLDFLDKDSKLNATVFILFLIPGLPNDIFTYLFPLTKIKPSNFFVLSMIGRTLGVVLGSMIGDALAKGDIIRLVVVGVIAATLAILGVIYNKKIVALTQKIESRLRKN